MSSPDPVERLLSLLEGVKQTGPDKFLARCPAHDDLKQSLSIGRGDNGGAVLHCFANCPNDAIVARLGLTLSDLFPPKPAAPSRPDAPRVKGRVVAAYDYTDETGTLVYQVERDHNKEFWPRRPDRRGGWLNNLQSVRRVPYRLPELLDAVKAGRTVFVCEGEKDCDNLRAAGLEATTNFGGVGGVNQWRAFGVFFQGARRVVILPDNDGAGRDFAQKVAGFLAGSAASVRVLNLPGLSQKGADVSDWLKAGGTADELMRLADAAAEWTPSRPAKSVDAGDGRPLIETNNRDPLTIADEAIAALVKGNQPPNLFRQAGRMVRAATDEHNRMRLEALTPQSMRYHLTQTGRFTSTSAKRGVVEVQPPTWLADHLLSIPGGIGQIPAVVGIVGAPVIAPDRTIATVPGYLPDLQTLYHEAAGQLDLPDTTPTETNVKNALALLEKVFDGFPFANEGSWAHCLALLFQPFVRRVIAGPTPLFLIDAPQISTGKTLLARTATAFFTPGGADVTPAPKDGVEWQKTIATLLRGGASHVLIDNVKGLLESDALEAALTSTSYKARLLGSMDELILPNFATWIMTANNATLSKDLATRAVTIRLDSGEEKPWERGGFAIADPPAWVAEHRGAAVGAVLTLLRAWIEAGCPVYAGKGANRFTSWTAITGGILETIGVPGFLSNIAESLDCLDPEDLAWQAFVAAWFERFDHRPVTTADLLPLAIGENEDPAILADYIDAKDDAGRKKRLGRALADRRDRVYAGYRLTRLPGTKTPQYRLDRGGLGGSGGFSQKYTGEYPRDTHIINTPQGTDDRNPANPPNPPPLEHAPGKVRFDDFAEFCREHPDDEDEFSDLTDPFAADANVDESEEQP